MDKALLQIFKRALLIVAGSGLLTNALYIYGLGFYQGYLEAFGFEYAFFSINWSDTIIWTYYASRELGANLIVSMNDSAPMLILSFPIVYIFARVWSSLSTIENKSSLSTTSVINFKNYYQKKRFILFKKNNPSLYRYLYIPMVWLFAKEQAIFAFLASYFFLFFLALLPLLIAMWVFLPNIGESHGKKVVNDYLDRKTKTLCDIDKNGWSPCITIKTDHLNNYDKKIKLKEVTGILIVKNGSYIGMHTKSGAITMTLPNTFFYQNIKNLKTQ